jgi:hypothetical protein
VEDDADADMLVKTHVLFTCALARLKGVSFFTRTRKIQAFIGTIATINTDAISRMVTPCVSLTSVASFDRSQMRVC